MPQGPRLRIEAQIGVDEADIETRMFKITDYRIAIAHVIDTVAQLK